MIKIISYEISDGKNGIKINFPSNKPVLFVAPPKFGKTIMVHAFVGTFGNKNAQKALVGQNGIKKSIKTNINIQIAENNFWLGAEFKLVDNDVKLVYNFQENDDSQLFFSSSSAEIASKILTLIRYPRWVTWDGDGKETQLEDLLIPFFVNQDWEPGFGNSMKLTYKKQNRIATSLLFYSKNQDKRFLEFHHNDELLKKMLNIDRLQSNRISLLKMLRDSVLTEDEDRVNQKFQQKIKLENEYKAITDGINNNFRTNQTKIANLKRNTLFFTELVTTKLEETFGREVAQKVQNTLSELWLSSLVTPNKVEGFTRVNEEAKKIRRDLMDLDREILQILPNFKISQEYYSFIEKNIPEDDKVSDKEKKEFDRLKRNWKEIYDDIKYKYRSFMEREFTNIIIREGFGFDPSTFGTNKQTMMFHSFKFLNEIIDKPFIILDSIFQNDNNEAEVDELQRRLAILKASNLTNGIVMSTKYNDLVLEGLYRNKLFEVFAPRSNHLFEGYEEFK